MADFTWPRKIVPMRVTGLQDWKGGKMRAQSGNPQVRNENAAGVEWSEHYPPLKPRRADDMELYQLIRYAGSRNALVDIELVNWPGSGAPPGGEGASGVAVNGGSQAGDSLDLTGFSAGASPAVRIGDVFRVAGIDRVLWCRETVDADAGGNATVKFMVPILAGNEPVNGAAVTLTDVKLEAYVWDWSGKPSTTRVDSFGGIRVDFVERVR